MYIYHFTCCFISQTFHPYSILFINIKYKTFPINAFDISRQSIFSSIIYLYDFVNIIIDDSNQDAPNYIEIQTDINIFNKDGFYSFEVVVELIYIRIYIYLIQEERVLYVLNTFFYIDGHFFIALSINNALEISIQTLSLIRYI